MICRDGGMELWAEGRQRWSDRDVVLSSTLTGAEVMERIRGGQTGHPTSRVNDEIDHTYLVRGWAGHDWFRIYARRHHLGTGMPRLATGTVHDVPDGGCTLHATFWITQFGPGTMARWLFAAVTVAVVLFVAGSVAPAATTLLYGWLVLSAVAVLGVTVADRMSRRAELALEGWLRFCTDDSITGALHR